MPASSTDYHQNQDTPDLFSVPLNKTGRSVSQPSDAQTVKYEQPRTGFELESPCQFFYDDNRYTLSTYHVHTYIHTYTFMWCSGDCLCKFIPYCTFNEFRKTKCKVGSPRCVVANVLDYDIVFC